MRDIALSCPDYDEDQETINAVTNVSQNRTLAIDFTQEDAVRRVYPEAPLLSSRHLPWQGIHMGHYWQPAHETPEYQPQQCLISIHLGQPVNICQRWQDGLSTNEFQSYGDVSIYPTTRSLQETWNAEAEFFEIYLTPTLLSQVAYESFDGDVVEVLPQPSIRDPLIQQLGLSLKSELESTVADTGAIASKGSRLLAESVSSVMAIHLLKRYSSHKPIIRDYSDGLPKYKLQVAIDYIQANLGANISLHELSQTVGMSMHHFSRLFKKSVGYSPYQYVLKCRVERAKMLLLQRQLTIADIAFAVGFASQSHLTQHFKRFVGVTPKQFLNQ